MNRECLISNAPGSQVVIGKRVKRDDISYDGNRVDLKSGQIVRIDLKPSVKTAADYEYNSTSGYKGPRFREVIVRPWENDNRLKKELGERAIADDLTLKVSAVDKGREKPLV